MTDEEFETRLQGLIAGQKLTVSSTDELSELSARLYAQRVVLQQVCARLFAGDAQGLQFFMDGCRQAAQSGEEDVGEMQARIESRLDRFRDAVALQLAVDRPGE